ncbi:MAG: glycosyltransferase family 4 protein [Planctomycetota bacterium]|jgi:glycosyltransferase involved in cell wall biosynthesis
MKLGIDFRPALLGETGIGRSVREMTRAMALLLEDHEEMKLFGVAFRQPEKLREDLDWILDARGVEFVRRRFPNRILQGLARLRMMGVESFTGPLDLFLHTDFTYAPLRATPSVLIVYDLCFLHPLAGYHPPAFCRIVGKRVRKALIRARGVVVPSRTVQEDLKTYFPDLGMPVRVVPLGGDHLLRPDESPGTGDEPAPFEKPFLLSVGTFEPRKNRLRLLRAFESVANDFPDLELMVLGRPGWLDEPFAKALEQSTFRQRITILHDADDRLLRRCYEKALALVYPCLDEGFGLPLVEAMSLGCPVITSNRSSMAEVVQDAALLVDPRDTRSMASAFRKVIQDASLGEKLRQAGKKRSRELTWGRTAADIMDFLRSLV